MPIIELKRDPNFTRNAQNSYSLLFVIPTPEETDMVEFEHPKLVKLERTEQTHAKGSKVFLPIVPGPFGDYHWSMMPKQDTSNIVGRGLGFNAGTEYMRWFYADELLDKMLLNENRTDHCFAPLDYLYTCSDNFYTNWCANHPGRTPEINFDYLCTTQQRSGVRQDEAACLHPVDRGKEGSRFKHGEEA